MEKEKIDNDRAQAGNTTKSHTKKKGRWIFNIIRYIIMAAAAITFTYTSYSLMKSYLEYKTGDDAYANIDNIFMEDAGDGKNTEQVSNKKKWVWNYDKLFAQNNQVKGFIRQKNTQIKYPILQGTDNDYYLTHLLDGTYNKNGAIFIDYQIEKGLNAQNCVLYGHNMWTDSMFGTLVKYKEKAYWEEHPDFDVYIKRKHYKYYVFASFEAYATGDDVYQYAFQDDAAFKSWQQTVRARSFYHVDTIPELTSKDKILTLSTCTTRNDESKRVVVLCVRGEEIKD